MSGELTSVFQNEVIRASAGTGKTFALSNRFLRLLASGVECQTILATTFTRKGSGEILDRIVQRLAKACLNDEAAATLALQLEWPSLDLPCARQLLRELMGNLHRLQVGTLDAFFYRIAQAFRLELGLPTEWAIVDDQQVRILHNRTIREILREQSVIDLVYLLTQGEAGRRIADLIRSTVASLYDVYLASDREAWDRLPPRPPFNPLRDFEDQIAAIEAAKYPHKSQFNKVVEEMKLVRSGDWSELSCSSLFTSLATGENMFYKKPLPEACVAAYQPIVEQCRDYVIDMLTRKNLSTYGLLDAFGTLLEAEKDRLGKLRFQDITRKLESFINDGSTDRFTFRLDHRVDHLLLDEFQDTSIAQWNVIRPFAMQTTADDSEKSFFCVGDLKQAIYGWREGVAEIFDRVEGELGNMSAAPPLTASYRSSPVIIDVVNRVFQNLERFQPKEELVRSAVSGWSNRFETHQTTRLELPGFFTMEYAAESGDKQEGTRNENLLIATVDRIRQLHRDLPGRSIGVLTRENESIGRLIFMLQEAGIPASEEGGNPLTDSAAVEQVLSAMTLADHPGDSVARFHLSHGPLAAEFGLQPEDQKNQSDNRLAGAAAAEHLRQRISAGGYGPTTEFLANTLAPVCTRRELLRLQQLVQQAFNYDHGQNEVGMLLRPSRFVTHIRDEFRASDESAAAVRVMTIHQSKGLEFDVVVLPLKATKTGWFVGQSPLIVGRENATAPMNLVCRLVNQDQRALLPPEFQAAFDETRRREVFDAMCVLYVALTRAVHATHVVMSMGCKANTGSSAGVLLSTLVPEWNEKNREQGLCFSSGDSNWHQQDSPVAPPKSEPDLHSFYLPAAAQTGPILFAAESKTGRGIARVSPSGLEGGNSISMNSIFSALANADQLQRGTLIHACFEKIGWLDEAVPQRQDLIDHLKTLGLWIHDFELVISDFEAMIGRSGLVSLLDRRRYLQTWTADAVAGGSTIFDALRVEYSNERRFAIHLDQQLMQGTIDRLVQVYEGNRLIAADIIDYKTDAVDDDASTQSRIQYYRPQMEAYRRAASRFCRLPIEQISARLVFVESDRIVTLPQALTGSESNTAATEPAPHVGPSHNADPRASVRKPSFQSRKQLKLWSED